MIRKRGSFKLKASIAQFKREKSILPRILGNMAKNHFLENFRKKGFVDQRLKRWPKRFKRLRKGRVSRTQKETATLIKKGRLRRSIRVRKANFRIIRIATAGVRYAAIHNFGLKGKAFGKHEFDMPERKYIGDSRKLEKKLEKRVFREIDKVFK